MAVLAALVAGVAVLVVAGVVLVGEVHCPFGKQGTHKVEPE